MKGWIIESLSYGFHLEAERLTYEWGHCSKHYQKEASFTRCIRSIEFQHFSILWPVFSKLTDLPTRFFRVEWMSDAEGFHCSNVLAAWPNAGFHMCGSSHSKSNCVSSGEGEGLSSCKLQSCRLVELNLRPVQFLFALDTFAKMVKTVSKQRPLLLLTAKDFS